MSLTVLLLVVTSMVAQGARPFEPCSGTFCPPSWTRPRPAGDEPAPMFLGRDPASGCRCRSNPGQYVICYSREECRKFPKHVNVSTPTLKVRSTRIEAIEVGDCDHLSNITELVIEENHLLHKIAVGVFGRMAKLRNLSISHNLNLWRIETGVFAGLNELRELFLIKNKFEKILDVSPALTQLPNLIKLDLSENNFREITKNDFASLSNLNLQELNLILCRIERIDVESLGFLRKLHALRLGENNFNESVITEVIQKTIQQGVPLKLLNLYGVGFRKSPPLKLLQAIGNSNISSLCLARNQFEEITSETFPHMPNLEILDLREVLALNITNNAFIGMPKLKTLLLSGNKLSSIPEGVLLHQLTYLDLQENSGNPFSPSYFSIFGRKFTNMKKLELLNLSFNRLVALYNTTFSGLSNLRILGLKNATLYQIVNNSFSMLSKLVFLNLENNYFAKNTPNGIELGTFTGLNNLKVLLLGGCKISFISKYGDPFKDLKNLIHLGLERNHLLTIEASDFGNLIKLESLDLAHNRLQPWHVQIFAENEHLRLVKANNNKFAFISNSMLTDFRNLTDLDLRENPFTCDCQHLQRYQRSTVKIWELIDQIPPMCAFPDTTTNWTLPKFVLSAINCEQFHHNLSRTIFPLVLLVGFFMILAFISWYYRWHLRYWIFLTRLYLSRKGRIRSNYEKTGHDNYLYDAFVSYSNEDRNFVIRLVTMLENYHPHLKLCVYERDFQIGTVISESVLESVARSRKTLLIISDSYAKSQWCRWEAQIAEHHRLFFENQNGEYVDDSLVLIKLGPVSENHLTPTLKYLLKTRIYLLWDGNDRKQKMFWEKLRSTLAPPAQEINENTHL